MLMINIHLFPKSLGNVSQMDTEVLRYEFSLQSEDLNLQVAQQHWH